MNPHETERANRLVALAIERFDAELSEAEERVLRESCAYDNPALPLLDASHAAPYGRPLASWEGPVVRPALLRWALTDKDAVALLEARGLRAWNVRFTEALDLSFANAPLPVQFRFCRFQAAADFEGASFAALALEACALEQGVAGKNLRLQGELSLTGNESSGPVELDGIAAGGAVFLKDLACTAEIRILNADIGAILSCASAKLTATGNCLSLDQAKIRGSVFLTEGFEAAGTIRLHGADIGGLDCSGAKLTATGDSLSLDGAKIRGGVFLREWIEARGDVFLTEEFEASGEVRMLGADIGGQLDCTGASISRFIGYMMQVRGVFFWTNMQNAELASLDLTGATAQQFVDDKHSWPGELILDGFTTQELKPLDSGNDRIAWLERQPENHKSKPQPWMHVAQLLEAKGDRTAARQVIRKLRHYQSEENRRSKFVLWRWGFRLWDWFQAGLERNPFRVVYSILILMAVFGTIFFGYRAHFSETGEAAYRQTHVQHTDAKAVPAAYPKFSPFIYALENELPVVKLGQDDHWAPDARNSTRRLYWTLMGLRWFLILWGYFQAAVLASAIATRLRT